MAPFLLILGFWLSRQVHAGAATKATIVIPWFAVAFIAVAGFNSLGLLPGTVVTTINHLDTFALTMAMTALGMETRMEKFKGVGMKPIYLALILFGWLMVGGYQMAKMLG